MSIECGERCDKTGGLETKHGPSAAAAVLRKRADVSDVER
jgi:hypothetical protein